jgi:hypothetical protein
MKKTRFTEEQMVAILREAGQRPVPEVVKKHRVSSQTIYGWRKHFGTLEPADINTQQLRDLAKAGHDAGKEFVLWVRHETVLSGPLDQACRTGQVIIRRFGWP